MSKEVKDLLVEYCEWCKAQGGNCQANLDGCSIFDALALLKPKDQPSSEFTKEFRRHLERERKSMGFAIWARAKEACDRLDITNALNRRLKKDSESIKVDLLDACKIGLEKALGISTVSTELGAKITPTHKKHIEIMEAAIAKASENKKC